MALLAWMAGCQQQTTTTAPITSTQASNAPATVVRTPPKKLNPLRLRADLLFFADDFAAEVAGTAATIAADTDDRRLREKALYFKIRTIPAMQAAVGQEDPRGAFLDAWAICIMIHDYADRPRAKALLGDRQPALLELAIEFEQEILEIGRRHFSSRQLELAKREIEAFADGHPLSDRFDFDATHLDRSDGNAILSLLTMPMAPMRGMEGIGNTPDAIMHVAALASTVGDIIRYLPVSIRWQVELLLLEMQSLDVVRQASADFTRLSESFERASIAAETLPADVRQEIEAAFTSLDESQENIQTTLHAARETLTELNQSLTQAENVMGLVSQTTTDLTEAGAAWGHTAETMNEFVVTIQSLQEPDDAADGSDGGGFDIKDYERAGIQVQAAAAELRGFLNDTQSESLGSAFTELGKTTASSVDHAVARADGFLNAVLLRGLALVGALLVGLLVVGMILIRMARRPVSPG